MNDRSKTQTNECAPPMVLKVSSFVKKTTTKKKDQGLAAGVRRRQLQRMIIGYQGKGSRSGKRAVTGG